jgi:hypothetical protein
VAPTPQLLAKLHFWFLLLAAAAVVVAPMPQTMVVAAEALEQQFGYTQVAKWEVPQQLLLAQQEQQEYMLLAQAEGLVEQQLLIPLVQV